MSYRHRMAKPSVFLWTLVVVGNVALILAGMGTVALIALGGVVVTVAVATFGGMLMRRGDVRQLVAARR